MKYLTLILGLLLIICNLIIGLLLSFYPDFNVWFNCAVIAETTCLLFVMQQIRLRDAYRIALSVFCMGAGIIEFILGVFAPPRWENNLPLLLIICMFILKISCILITNYMSNLLKH